MPSVSKWLGAQTYERLIAQADDPCHARDEGRYLTAEQAGARPITDLVSARRNAVLAAATMGGVLVTLDISVVNVALKALQQSFDVGGPVVTDPKVRFR